MGMIHPDKNNADARNEFSPTEIKRINGQTPFMIASRGGCSFVQKIRNMENAGVAAGVIVDGSVDFPDAATAASASTLLLLYLPLLLYLLLILD